MMTQRCKLETWIFGKFPWGKVNHLDADKLVGDFHVPGELKQNAALFCLCIIKNNLYKLACEW